jgi:hypothetical protein
VYIGRYRVYLGGLLVAVTEKARAATEREAEVLATAAKVAGRATLRHRANEAIVGVKEGVVAVAWSS